MQDKRRSFRLPMELPVAFKVHPEQAHVSLGTTSEISALGLSFITKEYIPPMQELHLQVKLNDGKKIVLPVKVIWMRQMVAVDTPDYVVGVKLLEPLSVEMTQYIKFYVRFFMDAFKNSRPS